MPITITPEQLKLLNDYKDRSYIMNLLCSNSNEFFSFLSSIVKFPIIISSSVMSLLNSANDIDVSVMRYINMSLNVSTALLLSLLSHFKIEAKMNNFKVMATKFNKLNHTIENLVVNELNEIDTDRIQSIINEYDALCENLDEPFPHHIKKRLCTKYHGKKILPTALSSELCYISNRNSPTPSESDI